MEIINEVLFSVLESVQMVTSFSIFMLFCLAANTALGVVDASQHREFEFSKLFKGIFRNLIVVVGIDLLAIGVSGLSKLIEIYNILPEYSDAFNSVTTLGIVAIIITLSYQVYGKQAIEKLKALGNLSDDDIIPIQRQNGWEERGT